MFRGPFFSGHGVHTFSPFLVCSAISMYFRSSSLMRGCVAGVSYTVKYQQTDQNMATAPAQHKTPIHTAHVSFVINKKTILISIIYCKNHSKSVKQLVWCDQCHLLYYQLYGHRYKRLQSCKDNAANSTSRNRLQK